MMNSDQQIVEIILRRDIRSTPWGFRMQGGSDFEIPLSVVLVNKGSLAENGDVQPGDAILRIADNATDILTHDEAKNLVLNCENECKLLLQRGSVNIWKPKITLFTQLKTNQPQVLPDYGDADGAYVQRTSLAANKQEFMHAGGSHNQTARSFNADQSPFMSETAIYSYDTIENAVSEKPYTPPPMFSNNKPEEQISKPSGFKSVRAPIAKPPSEIKETKHMACKNCGKVCVGVFVRIRGNPYHPECFLCSLCGKNLKNYGHFEVGGQLYCESCVDSPES